jgi:hypothetical protein
MMVDPKGQAHGNEAERQGPDDDNNLGRGAPADRQERIQQRAREDARSADRNPQKEHREAHDLDREDVELHREGAAD